MTDTPVDEDFGKLHPDEFGAGRAAFQAGASRRSNPVRGDQGKRLAWYWGYTEAENESLPDDEELSPVTVGDLIEHLTRLYPREAHVHLTVAEHRELGSVPAAVCLDVALKHIRSASKGSSI